MNPNLLILLRLVHYSMQNRPSQAENLDFTMLAITMVSLSTVSCWIW